MERDPDYIDPEVLKRRAAVSGGAGARSSRPRVRRVADNPGLAVVGARSTFRSVATGVGIAVSEHSATVVRNR